MPRGSALSDHDANTLIKEVEKRNCLWDPDDERYNDRYHMARAWSEIAEMIHMPETRLRVKWKNMRDLYRKEVKRFGSHDEYMGRWRHFKSLAFLNKTTTANNGSENNEESNEAIEPVTKQEYVELDADGESENPVEIFYDDTYEDPLPEKRPKMTLPEEDYDVMFLKSLAPYFKQLDPMRKLVVRSKMQDMLLNEIAAQTSSQFQFKKSI